MIPASTHPELHEPIRVVYLNWCGAATNASTPSQHSINSISRASADKLGPTRVVWALPFPARAKKAGTNSREVGRG